ncbi:biopolymer transporter ExbB [Vibrio breoganii]|uniref:Biopolymer transporter ExbB n=1 Tax=Vibrio breoganii TaxID=553239 RepID=A0AAN0XXN2_9VIBR|nr:MotA/TolQ/ExbB proton channel family protein [Vibrio breoganii]ANO34412.1 biopolymer transporter ExbB [Vibrio breoganii]OED85209.1 biopolymer transporter ExbB [Vibrio breoganii ZF-55]PMG83479.1 biopolymer transporter ExbB [Vibrio breoganii]PMK46515.1 biopolymer transporter ExbB [Vibrio breoganii]PML09253.1 biopolymer transporter ExbB [Vibrio breoganii]
MQILITLHGQLGMMTIPLTVLSALTLMLIIERTLFMLVNGRTHTTQILSKVHHINFANSAQVERFIEQDLQGKTIIYQAMRMLLGHRSFTKELREEAVSIWLFKKRQQYKSGIRILSIIGVISPLIGLLGTVLGLIDMFKGLAHTSGAISPAVLADGLGLAMSTTAVGLLIALPAITGAQLLSMWVEKTLAKIEYTLNHSNLHIEGIYIDCQDNAKNCEEVVA